MASLQRSVGNAAVGAMIARQPGGAAAVADPALDPTQLTESDIIFKRLPPGRGWLTGTGRNQMALELHNEFEHVFEVSQKAQTNMSFLYWTEDAMGPRNLAIVEKVAPVVAKKSAGDAGERMRKAVDEYTQAFPELESTLTNLKGAEAEVVGKAEKFLQAVTEQKETAAKRVEKKAEGEVKDVQEKIEKAKKWVDEVIDGTFKVFTGEWKEALQDIGKFALKELIAGPVVESFYQEQLDKAQTQLAKAKEIVASLEDERDFHAVNSAAKELEAARDRFSAMTTHLVAVGRRANSAHRTLIEKLSGLGPAGARAAEALESREEVAEQAKLGVEVLAEYEQLVQKASKDAHFLMVSYHNYADFALSPGGENEVPNEDLRHRLYEIADSNEWTCKHLENWCTDELGRIAKARAYIAGGSYMEPYRKIDETLASAVANR